VEQLKPSFVWTFTEKDADGHVLSVETVRNLIPVEGLNYILNASFKGGTQYATLYCGLFEGNYTPIPADTMAAFPAAATECTTYTSATRPAVTFGSVASGNMDNLSNLVEFTGNADRTVYGGFLSTSNVKGGTTGVLCSVVRAPSTKSLSNGGRIEVALAFQFVSV
jgi:hypothetical protein